jgi:type IV secretory pathway component VirB8
MTFDDMLDIELDKKEAKTGETFSDERRARWKRKVIVRIFGVVVIGAVAVVAVIGLLVRLFVLAAGL